MITIAIITKAELIAALVLVGLLAMYGLSGYSLRKSQNLTAKIKAMSDDELFSCFDTLKKSYEEKATYWKGQELSRILEERKRRRLFERLSDDEFMVLYNKARTRYEIKSTYWNKREITYYNEELKKRRWKGHQI